jgi:hypothetical protein
MHPEGQNGGSRSNQGSQPEPPPDRIMETPEFIKTLYRDKQMRRFKKLFREIEIKISQSKPADDVSNIEMMLNSIQTEVDGMTDENKQMVY